MLFNLMSIYNFYKYLVTLFIWYLVISSTGVSRCELDPISELPPPLPDYLGFPYIIEKEIKEPKKNLIVGRVLGKGQFGIVHHGLKRSETGREDVAIKILKRGASPEDFDNLLNEIKVAQYVGEHDNVVKYIGAVTKNIHKQKVKIVYEYCILKDLKGYLCQHNGSFQGAFEKPTKNGYRSENVLTTSKLTYVQSYSQPHRPITTADLFNWSSQIASGMEYLSSKGVVHRDLAARNVLLQGNLICKITDFGLSKNLHNTTRTCYVPRRPKDKQKVYLPWLWLAIEAFPTEFTSPVFSTDSDVWAFGVTLWEIFSLGQDPYPDYSDDNLLIKLPEDLKKGYRMKKPEHADNAIYKIMLDCWNYEGSARPRFTVLKNNLTRKARLNSTTFFTGLM